MYFLRNENLHYLRWANSGKAASQVREPIYVTRSYQKEKADSTKNECISSSKFYSWMFSIKLGEKTRHPVNIKLQ